MPKMDRGALRTLLSAERQSALADTASQLSSERDDALMYYMGDMSKDMPAPEGRSSAVSMDVADTVEGLLPYLMEIFAGGDETVEFAPVSKEDVEGAQQETDYVNHVFMHQNPGFLILYSFIKDALLSKVGVVKVWWEKREEEERETYYDLTDDQFSILVADEDVTITEHTAKPDPNYNPQPDQIDLETGNALQSQQLHDVVVTKAKTFEEAKVLGIPPEEFGIEKGARTLRRGVPGGCTYCFHRTTPTQSSLIAQGYDEGQVKTLPTYSATTSAEEINRDSVAEHETAGEDHNEASRRIEVTEHYIVMDYEGKGKACLYKVTTGGESDEILIKDGKDDIEEFDEFPFAAMTPVIVTHRFFGRSMADLVKDIQRIKTSLLRALLDNAYLANNPRVEVAETFASDNTLDDLLISRPGGIVRTKTPGGLNWQQVPTIGSHIYPLMEYQDSARQMRSGVSLAGQGIDANALQNQSATAVNQMFTMAQARMRLVARIFAETGIKDLFWLLHQIIRKHGQQRQTVQLRKQWVEVDPRNWKKRDNLTVNVGLGTGGKAEQLAMLTVIAGLQEKALSGGYSNIVTPQNVYNTGKQITRVVGHKDVDAFFSDPATQPAPQQAPNPKLIELQMKAQLDQQKVAADIKHQGMKLQADMALEQQKFEHDKELAIIESGLKKEEHHANLVMKIADHATKSVHPETNQPIPMHPAVQSLIENISKPKGPRKIVRDQHNNIIGVEEGHDHPAPQKNFRPVVRDQQNKIVGFK